MYKMRYKGTFYEEEPPFERIIVPAIVTFSLVIVAVILRHVLWYVAGWLSSSEDIRFIFSNMQVGGMGVGLPVAALVLSLVGRRTYQKSEYISLIFGIAITALSAVLIGLLTYWIIVNILQLIVNLEYAVFYAVIMACFAAALAMQILNLIGGIKIIRYYTNELH